MFENREVGKHGYDGACAPGKCLGPVGDTFSVGIFKWLPAKNREGMKPSAVIYRVKGSSSFPEKVYDRAQKVCDALDAGWTPNKKSESV